MKRELMLSPTAKNIGQAEYDDIQMAIQKLSSVSQDQFEEIKKEKWYNRLWDMVTFSQKGKKRLAEQIGTVAQAQQILVELLLRLSDQNRNITELVMKNANYIEKIQHDNIYLLTEINLLKDKIADINIKVKYDANIMDLSADEKRALSGCLYHLAELNDCPTSAQKEYVNFILNFIAENTRMENPFAAIEDFNGKVKGKILACCMEYMFLENDDLSAFDKYQDFIDEFDCGKRTIADLQEQILSIFKARGEQGFIDRYNHNDKSISPLFYVEFEEDGIVNHNYEDKYDETTEEGIIFNKKLLKYLRAREKNETKVTRKIAEKFFAFNGYNQGETDNHIIFSKDEHVFLFSKLTGESREFNILNLLREYYSLSEATSDYVVRNYMAIVSAGITAFGNGFFFSLRDSIFYAEIGDDADECNLVIDLSNISAEEKWIRIKGIESKYFIFSYESAERDCWCLLNMETGKLLKPKELEDKSSFFVLDDYAYYENAEFVKYRSFKTSVQIFQYNLITGKANPASEKIDMISSQSKGLGLLERFEKVEDKYVMLRRSWPDSLLSMRGFAIPFNLDREYYLYIVFDSYFNVLNGCHFKSIDDNYAYDVHYCSNGIVVYKDIYDNLKVFSMISGKRKTIGNIGKTNSLYVQHCGNYHVVNHMKDGLIDANEF